MPTTPLTVLIVGATGSIGRLVVGEALEQGHRTRALVRDADRAQLSAAAELVVGDLTRPETLDGAVDDVDAVIFTHGSHGGRGEAQHIDYDGVRNVLAAIGPRPVHVALMTAIGVTTGRAHTTSSRRCTTGSAARSDLFAPAATGTRSCARAGLTTTPPPSSSWSCCRATRGRAGDAGDGVIAREQIAEVLVGTLTHPGAVGMTFELVAVTGPRTTDLEPVFAALQPDMGLDGVGDEANMPAGDEPEHVIRDLEDARERSTTQPTRN